MKSLSNIWQLRDSRYQHAIICMTIQRYTNFILRGFLTPPKIPFTYFIYSIFYKKNEILITECAPCPTFHKSSNYWYAVQYILQVLLSLLLIQSKLICLSGLPNLIPIPPPPSLHLFYYSSQAHKESSFLPADWETTPLCK